MKRLRTLQTLLFLVSPGLVACQTTSPSALIAMASFDPLTTNPADLGLQIVVPDDVGLRNGDLELRLADDAPSGRIAGTFPLEIGRKRLDGQRARYTGRLSAEQASAMRQLQQRIQRGRAESKASGTGSFGVHLVAACTTSGTLPSPMPVKVAIKVSSGSFIPAVDSSDLPAQLNEVDRAALQSRIRRCPE